MPLSEILKKIDETSAAESESILAEARTRSEKILADAKDMADSRREQIVGEARQKAQRAESLGRSRAQALRRRLILEEKQALIDSVFAEALSRLSDMPAAEYKDLLIGSLCIYAEGDEVLTLGPEDEVKLGADFAKAANDALKASGKDERLTVAYAASPFGGGFILTRGGVSQNLVFPTLVNRLRDEMEMEVARMLFS